MKTIRGESKRYLEIDLSARAFSVFSPSERDLADYIGGKGLGLKLIYDRLGPRLAAVDPLGPENILAFMMGTFIGTGAPCSARFAGLSKSPLTGIMLSCSCGGPFGMACKTAGWDGVLVSGRAERPVVIRIDENGAGFEDAGGLWGLETGPAQARLADKPGQAALVIGPAGENRVSYANVRSGNRYLGRGGLGAVMGSKNLKAIVAQGGAYKIEAAEPERFKRANAKARVYINRNAFIRSYRAFGTNYATSFGMRAGFAPVRNFRDRTDQRLAAVTGEAMAERYKTSHAACAACPILCGHKGSYPDGKVRHIPEYETTGVWGGNLLNFDPDLIGAWNERLNELGLDSISCGVSFGWAMEAAEKGLRPSRLAFGRTDNIAATIEDVAYKRGEGAELAEGTRRLSERYGGADFAIQVKGLEIAAYDPRAAWGQALNYAVANRGGCHLNAYPIGLELLFGFIPPYSKISKAKWVAYLEDLFTAVNSTHTCLFSIYGYMLEPFVARFTPRPLLKLTMTLLPGLAQRLLDLGALTGQIAAITGRPLDQAAFLAAGRRAHVLERWMNVKMGVGPADDSLPGRFLTEGDTKHPVKKTVPIRQLVRSYYRVKGYGPDGAPSARLRASLGLGEPAGRPDQAALAAEYPERVPPARPLARLYVRIALGLLGRAFSLAHRLDRDVRRELSGLPAGFCFALRVHPAGPAAALRLGSDGRLRHLRDCPASPELTMSFLNLKAALSVLSFSASSFQVYAWNGLAISGDLGATMAVMRTLGIIETLLLPRFLARRVLKRPYRMGFFRLWLERAALYLGLPFTLPLKEKT